MKKLLFCLLASPFILANSCTEMPVSQSLADTSWQLEYLFGDAVVPELENSLPQLRFSADNKISGRGTCNSFSGTYKLLEGDSLDIGPLARTKKYCPHMDKEDQFIFALESTDMYRVESGKLELLGEGEIILVLRPQSGS
ncbi:MAG: META domain-containing protein [Bacteroidetes bacterium]|nr:META domain-containing protein [Bacteroidota bacterium]